MFGFTAIFGVGLCVGVSLISPGNLCPVSFTVRCLYCCILIFCMDACVGVAWFGVHIVVVSVDLRVLRGCATRSVSCLDPPAPVGLRAWQKVLCLLCLCVQGKLAALQKFRLSAEAFDTEADAKAVTVPQLLTLTACLSMDDAEAARYYCTGLALVADCGDVSCADVIMSAGCIPHVIDCLRHWPAHKGVVWNACWALAELAEKGSDSVRTAIKSVPGTQATLQAAKESGLDSGLAARALSALGL